MELAKVSWEENAEEREYKRRQHRRYRGPEFRPADDRLAVDYLRHERTAYEWQLDVVGNALYDLEPVDEAGDNPMETFFDTLKNRSHATIREKTLEAIVAKYPELSSAAKHRRESNYTISGGQIMQNPRYRF